MLIALLLLAGAVVNVAVAWGIAAIGPVPQFGVKLFGVRGSANGKIDHADAIVVSAGRRTGREEAAAWHLPMEPPRGVASSVQAGFGYWQCWEANFSDNRMAVTHAVGFPRPAMRVSLRSAAPNLSAPRARKGSRMFARTGGEVPVRPFLPGFAINTLFYAAVLALPLSFFPIRRRLRARRGRCRRCGYDLAGLGGAEPGVEGRAPCPECGATR